ncbi:MAG: hypothetical protein ACTSVI_09490 [Promethearchaeota archaeon]
MHSRFGVVLTMLCPKCNQEMEYDSVYGVFRCAECDIEIPDDGDTDYETDVGY